MLGVNVIEEMGALNLQLAGGQRVFIYPKENHEPATFTVLNFEVAGHRRGGRRARRRAASVRALRGHGPGRDGIMRDNGPSIAWFKDPAGNILSVIESA